MNAVLGSGMLPRAISTTDSHVDVAFSWGQAWTPWPGRVHVQNFGLKVDDPVLQFHLGIEQATFNVAPLELLRRRFSASHIRASGVRFEFVSKVKRINGLEERLQGFPFLEGFTRPALLARPPLPALTTEELAKLWTVELNDIDATAAELWMLEFRYRGEAHVSGGFTFTPLQRLDISATSLDFDGGTLSGGTHVLSNALRAHAELEIDDVDLTAAPAGERIIKALTAKLQVESPVEDLSVLEAYLPGLHLKGVASLKADVQIEHGLLGSDSEVELTAPNFDAEFIDFHFNGSAHAKATLVGSSAKPSLRGELSGRFRVPVPESMPVTVQVAESSALVVLPDADVTTPWAPRISVVLGSLRIEDARPLTLSASRVLPIVGPMVLGHGPLEASATAFVTNEYTLIRLKHASWGQAEVEGAAIPGANGWNGAAAGHFGAIPVGLRWKNGALTGEAFVAKSWLNVEYLKSGIVPDPPSVR